MSTVIEVGDVWKKYRLGVIGTGTLRHDLERWWHRVRGKPDPHAKVGEIANRRTEVRDQKSDDGGQKSERRDQSLAAVTAKAYSSHRSAELGDDEVWALRGVSFEVKQGEILGIIGKNGAGKSTLLKILSRVTSPTKGEVRVKGRIASLLEVGTGFHPELTGRENIFLNGAILGMTKAEIRTKLDEIVAFAEIERFLGTPVKRYSSGMYVRLAFAVAAHLEPEILIVDEVLAVGDAEFQKKCLGKMKDVSRGGRTVLFVSHNMQAIRALCSRVLLLRNSRISHPSTVSAGIESYLDEKRKVPAVEWVSATDKRGKDLSFDRAKLLLLGQQPNLALELSLYLTSRRSHAPAFLAIDIADAAGAVVMQALPSLTGFMYSDRGPHQILARVELPPLVPGIYFVSLWVGSYNTRTFDSENDILAFEVTQSPTIGRTFPHTRDHGWIVPYSEIITTSPRAVESIPAS